MGDWALGASDWGKRQSESKRLDLACLWLGDSGAARARRMCRRGDCVAHRSFLAKSGWAEILLPTLCR